MPPTGGDAPPPPDGLLGPHGPSASRSSKRLQGQRRPLSTVATVHCGPKPAWHLGQPQACAVRRLLSAPLPRWGPRRLSPRHLVCAGAPRQRSEGPRVLAGACGLHSQPPGSRPRSRTVTRGHTSALRPSAEKRPLPATAVGDASTRGRARGCGDRHASGQRLPLGPGPAGRAPGSPSRVTPLAACHSPRRCSPSRRTPGGRRRPRGHLGTRRGELWSRPVGPGEGRTLPALHPEGRTPRPAQHPEGHFGAWGRHG